MSVSFELSNNYFLNDKCIASALTSEGVLSDFMVPSLKLARETTTTLSSEISSLSSALYFDDDGLGNKGLSGKVDFILSTEHDSVAYQGVMKKYGPPIVDFNLSAFINNSLKSEYDGRLKRGFMFKLSANQDTLSDEFRNTVFFGKEDFFIVNKDIPDVHHIHVDDLDIVRNSQAEVEWLSAALSNEIDRLSTSLSNTVDQRDRELSNLLSTYSNELCTSLSIAVDHRILDLSTALSGDIDALSTSLSTTVSVSVDNLQKQIISNDNDIEFLSGALSTEIKNNLDSVHFKGNVELSTKYDFSKAPAAMLTANTVVGLLMKNPEIDGDVNYKLRKGFAYRLSSEYKSQIFELSDNSDVEKVHNNDMLIIHNDVNALSDVRLSDIGFIRDYDISVDLLQKQILSNDSDVSYLSSTLSTSVFCVSLGYKSDISEYKSIDEIIEESYPTYKFNVGDILIAKKNIVKGNDELLEYTAYVYSSEKKWQAMDGNYSADNIFFKDDFSMDGDYVQIGNYKKVDKTVPSKGKSLFEVMQNMFDTTIAPTQGASPSYGISLANTDYNFRSENKLSIYYEVGKEITVKYNLTYTQGKYNYSWLVTDPKTVNDGTAFESATIKSLNSSKEDGSSDLVTSTGSNKSFGTKKTIASASNIQLKAESVTYSDGIVPVNSKGEECPSVQRLGATFTTTATTAQHIYGYYGCFYGWKDGTNSLTDAEIDAIDSDFVRGLESGSQMSFNGIQVETTNMKQMFFACYQTSKSITIKDHYTGAPASTEYFKKTVTVKDAGGNDNPYSLFYINKASPDSGTMTWDITLS